MTPPIICLICIGASFALLVAIVLGRAFMFVPEKRRQTKPEIVSVNGERATETLCEMIKCRTVSDRNKELEVDSEFRKFEELLSSLFPKVFSRCIVEKPSERSILIRWKGKTNKAPTVLMSHYDVVSVVEEDWEKPPFDAVIENGVLWGRGTLDTKGTLNGIPA